jgi:hypothetical protein
MDLEQRLRASMVAPKPSPQFATRVLARVAIDAARRRRRFGLLAGLVVLAAAAAIPVWRMSAIPSEPVAKVAMPAAPVREPVVVAPPAGASTIAIDEPARATPKAARDEVTSRRYSVQVMPLRQDTQDAQRRDSAEAFQAAMIAGLRAVPGLALHLPGETARGDDGKADYVLSITSLASRAAPSGGTSFRSTDGVTNHTIGNGMVVTSSGNGGAAARLRVTGDPEAIAWLEMVVESQGSAASRFDFAVGADGTPEQQANAQIETLRLQVFRPDPAFQQRVVERIGELGQDQVAQQKASQLLRALARDDGSGLDAGTLQAIARLAAGQPPPMRANIWATLRWAQVSHPALAAPLVECLRHDPDRQVRQVALDYLEAVYLADPLVRSALEVIGQSDPDENMRLVAQRALKGQAQWRAEILAALQRTDLPYEARLAPVVADMPVVSPRQQKQRRSALQEPQVVQPLVALLREHLQDPGHMQATRDALRQLVDIEDPSVFDLFLQSIRDAQALQKETTVRPGANPRIDMSGPVTDWVFRHRTDPRVLQSLSVADPQLRALVEQDGNVRMQDLPATPASAPIELPSSLMDRLKELSR